MEYADVIPRLEALAAQIRDDDLLLVEPRGASDLHVLALPLAYIYAKNVVVLSTGKPTPADMVRLLDWGSRRYSRVLYLGSGSSKLQFRTIGAEFLSSESIWVPEYERSADHVPTTSRLKEFVLGLFRLVPLKTPPPESHVDVGVADELAVGRFHSREQSGERRFRWTTSHSVIWLRMSAAPPSRVIVWMGNGGRPANAPPPTAGVFAGRSFLGFVDISTDEVRPVRVLAPAGGRCRGGA